MLPRLLPVIAALCLATSSVRAEPPGPKCPTLEESRTATKSLAEAEGWGYVELDGLPARAMLAEINAVDPPTHFVADHLAIVLSVRDRGGLVYLSDGQCGGHRTFVAMPLAIVLHIYQKVRGIGGETKQTL